MAHPVQYMYITLIHSFNGCSERHWGIWGSAEPQSLMQAKGNELHKTLLQRNIANAINDY